MNIRRDSHVQSHPELHVRFTKRKDGPVILQCIRGDGSVTWQRHDKQAIFFSFHDLAHYAVETALGFRNGFFGLIADGWDIVDTTGKGARGRIPAEAIIVEHVIGILERERGISELLTATAFNAELEELVFRDHPELVRRFDDHELSAVRTRVNSLRRQWMEVMPGSSLELWFDRNEISETRPVR
jgi:hypothetical protein